MPSNPPCQRKKATGGSGIDPRSVSVAHRPTATASLLRKQADSGLCVVRRRLVTPPLALRGRERLHPPRRSRSRKWRAGFDGKMPPSDDFGVIIVKKNAHIHHRFNYKHVEADEAEYRPNIEQTRPERKSESRFLQKKISKSEHELKRNHFRSTNEVEFSGRCFKVTEAKRWPCARLPRVAHV